MTERTVQDLLDLSGKVALVTGAAGWLGSAMSRALAEAGATLAVTSRDEQRWLGRRRKPCLPSNHRTSYPRRSSSFPL
ncbi:MAG: NAD-dependent epimerase/dehydratase family protein [Caldilineae bacterium]|nr:MAG: NAD-dependent epimerase/dehydratase family protein [Caldilineae bacterium]